jgi:hypothetical protein
VRGRARAPDDDERDAKLQNLKTLNFQNIKKANAKEKEKER